MSRRVLTVATLAAALDLPADTKVFFEMPNGRLVEVRSARHSLESSCLPHGDISEADAPADPEDGCRRALVLKG